MKTELYCPMCGYPLSKEGDTAVCYGCGIECSNVVISESIPFDGEFASEVSISMDCTLAKPKPPERPMPLEAEVSISEDMTA